LVSLGLLLPLPGLLPLAELLPPAELVATCPELVLFCALLPAGPLG